MKCVDWLAVLTVLATLLELQPASGQRAEEYCFETDREQRQTRHFSAKTAYQIAHSVNQRKYYNVPNCEPVKFWLFSRHGTRLPSADTIGNLAELVDFRDEILNNFQSKNRDRVPGQLCEEDLDLLRAWKWDHNITSIYGDFLTVQGWNDLKILAVDYQRQFKTLLEFIYTQNKFQFAYTDSQRTEASYKSFAIGLFGEEAFSHIHIPPVANDSLLLKPYDICPVFKENSKKSKEKDSESSKFQDGIIFKQMLSQVSVRLGFKYTLNPKQVERIWDMCRYNQAWDLSSPSAFCAAFTPEHVNVLEYLDDLKYYYKASYGNPENENIMCATVQDMVRNLESTTNPKVVAYFAHASGIQLLLTALGVAKDKATLRADNYELMKSRVFRTSELSPFAANLAVVKYDCPQDNERYKVQFFLNEKPINFDWCNIGLCDLQAVQHQYKKFVSADCSKIFCASSAQKFVASPVLGALISILIILLN